LTELLLDKKQKSSFTIKNCKNPGLFLSLVY